MIGRGGCKTIIVSKLMYGCGAFEWYQRECDNLEVIQNGFGRWLWKVGKIRNEVVIAYAYAYICSATSNW